MKKALVFICFITVFLSNFLWVSAQSVKTEHEIRFQNWMSPNDYISLLPSTATTGQFKLVLPPLLPSAGNLLSVGEVNGNIASLAWQPMNFIPKTGFIGDVSTFIGTTNSAPLKFFTDNTERFRLTESGKLLVNTIESIDDSLQAKVVGDVAVEGDLIVSGNVSSANFFVMPAGCIMQYAGSTAPDGWLICDGTELSRTDYPVLYAVILTTYGAGDGSSTFNIPNLSSRVPIGTSPSYTLASAGGEETHTLSVDEMPSHNHDFRMYNLSGNSASPSNLLFARQISGLSYTSATVASNIVAMSNLSIKATGSGDAHNNMPPYLVVNYIIKY